MTLRKGFFMPKHKNSKYSSRPLDSEGNALYTEEDNQTWRELFARQIPIIQDRACEEYIRGMRLLNLSTDRVPQCNEVSKVLQETTGWKLEPVPALISFDYFFYFYF